MWWGIFFAASWFRFTARGPHIRFPGRLLPQHEAIFDRQCDRQSGSQILFTLPPNSGEGDRNLQPEEEMVRNQRLIHNEDPYPA
jgi:hypothetical protein